MGFLDLEKLQEKTNYMVNIQILSPFIYNALSIYGKGRLAHFFFVTLNDGNRSEVPSEGVYSFSLW